MQSRFLCLRLLSVVLLLPGTANSIASPAAPAPIQPIGPGISATVTLPSGASAAIVSRKGIFPCIGLPPDQPVQVTLEFGTTMSGIAVQTLPNLVSAEAIDGGVLVAGPWVTAPNGQNTNLNRVIAGQISVTGRFVLSFLPARAPGLYQIRLRRGSEILGLQFWVNDPQNPANNPEVITPALTVPSPNPI